MELQGKSVLQLEEQPSAKKSIAVTRTFEKSVSTFEEMKERVSTFATVASEKLRKQNSCCYGIMLYIRKDQYKTSSERYNFSSYVHLPFATQSALTLSQTAIKMLKNVFENDEVYNKAGIILTEIIPQEQKQFHLFEEENPKHEKLMKVMDNIRKKTGERKIRLGNQDLNKTWKMKQNHLSKRYTTNSKELLEIKCH
jgi:DNA polymerase V